VASSRAGACGGHGYVGDPADPFGTYRVSSDGTVTVTMEPGNPIPSGQTVQIDARYRAIGPDGNLGVGHLALAMVGAG
jgi:hypothetical protein